METTASNSIDLHGVPWNPQELESYIENRSISFESYEYKLVKLNEIKTHSEQQDAQTYIDKFLVTDS